MLHHVSFVIVELLLELKAGMNSGECNRLLKDYLEAEFGLALNF